MRTLGVWLFLYDTVRRVQGFCINLYRPGGLLAEVLHLRALPATLLFYTLPQADMARPSWASARVVPRRPSWRTDGDAAPTTASQEGLQRWTPVD